MAFSKLTLSSAHAGQEITSHSQALEFLYRLDVSKQSFPHWQKVRQGLLIAENPRVLAIWRGASFARLCRLKAGLRHNVVSPIAVNLPSKCKSRATVFELIPFDGGTTLLFVLCRE
jgi:hypothetical protein